MELFSPSFIRCVKRTLDHSSCTVLGTIPAPKGEPLGLVEELRNRADVKVFIVSTHTSTLLGGGGHIWVSFRPGCSSALALYLLLLALEAAR